MCSIVRIIESNQFTDQEKQTLIYVLALAKNTDSVLKIKVKKNIYGSLKKLMLKGFIHEFHDKYMLSINKINHFVR